MDVHDLKLRICDLSDGGGWRLDGSVMDSTSIGGGGPLLTLSVFV